MMCGRYLSIVEAVQKSERMWMNGGGRKGKLKGFEYPFSCRIDRMQGFYGEIHET